MFTVTGGVVMPLPCMEYMYGVFRFRPISVKCVPVTVAMRMPDRRTL